MDTIHDPFFFIFILGLSLCVFNNWMSKILISRGILDSVSEFLFSRLQCLLLISAGSLPHFILDHLFEENSHSSIYTWILSTGWWKGRAPVNPDVVIVAGFLCTCLIGGFVYINRFIFRFHICL
ncbi:hypothetical protein GIB67_032528 [Kingdonia uniflora]|uniref:Uncharacterized protein n=1 Tax=Kingdonia uniflora TaxID=39325 RepID=A0A7J7L7T9_9MAGN|nr:hypothetical protein GIB67_032528 [Kingdonia uniflora]